MGSITRIVSLTLSLFCAAMPGWASQPEDPRPTLTLSEPWFQLGTTEHTWSYKIELRDVSEGTETTFILSLRVPERTRVDDVSQVDVNLTSRRRSPFTDINITTKQSTTVMLKITGRSNDVKAGPPVDHEWRAGPEANVTQVIASAPEEVYDPSLMRFVFGSGPSLRQDDHIDFSVDERILRIENDSRLRLATTVGALLKIGEFRNGRPIDVLVSLDFSQEPRRVLDGFMFGVAFGVNKYFSIGGGYELRVGRELSPGFRRTSAQLIEELLKDEVYKNAYARFGDLVDPTFENLTHYDWFPLEDPREQPKVVFGDPLITGHNHGWFLGVFVPVDFRRLFALRDGS